MTLKQLAFLIGGTALVIWGVIAFFVSKGCCP